MAESIGDTGNAGRVSQKQYYDELLAQRERMELLERRIMAHLEMTRAEIKCMATSADYEKLSTKMDSFMMQLTQYALKADVDKLSDRVSNLTMRDSVWNGINSLGVIIASIVGTMFGTRK